MSQMTHPPDAFLDYFTPRKRRRYLALTPFAVKSRLHREDAIMPMPNKADIRAQNNVYVFVRPRHIAREY